MLVNDLVNVGGITFAYRVTEDAGVGYLDAVRAFRDDAVSAGLSLHLPRSVHAAE